MLNKKEVAEKCKVSEVTIDRWRKIGFPFHKPNGGKVLFDEVEVDKWLKERDNITASNNLNCFHWEKRSIREE